MREPAETLPRFATRAAYRAWAEAQPRGRFEWVDGEVVAMAPERVGHNRTKIAAFLALRAAVAAAGAPCEVFIDGITVAVGDHADYEPDVVVNCGERLDADRVDAPDPIIVVEVLSPSTRGVDTGRKLMDYFLVPSVRHYLILRPDRPVIVHHRRDEAGEIRTALVTTGTITLDPPGLTVAVPAMFSA